MEENMNGEELDNIVILNDEEKIHKIKGRRKSYNK